MSCWLIITSRMPSFLSKSWKPQLLCLPKSRTRTRRDVVIYRKSNLTFLHLGVLIKVDIRKHSNGIRTTNTSTCICLIDLDCAFSVSPAESVGKGIYEVGIHVPDVAAYVAANTPLDREARERCCAVHVVDKKIPILPESFIQSHCRFDVGKQRLAYSVICRFTENGVLLHAWIGKTLVKTKQHVDINSLTKGASHMLKLCKKLQHNRLHELDGVSLAHACESFTLADSGYPQDIQCIHQTDQDVLLQELLILANIEVAQKISTRFPDQALLYRQAPANMSKLVSCIEYVYSALDTRCSCFSTDYYPGLLW